MEHKWADRNYRINFINNADFKTLNKYLKNLETLSKKGGPYLKLYNEDINYILNNDDNNNETENDTINIFFGNKHNNNTDMPTCNNTEAIMHNINLITQNVMMKQPTNTKEQQQSIFAKQQSVIDDIHKIEQCINLCNINFNNDKTTEKNVRESIRLFINIVMKCSKYDEDELNVLNEHIKVIMSLIKDNKVAIIEGHKYFGNKLQHHKNKIIIKLLQDVIALKNKKNKMNYDLYKQEKNKLIQESIKTNGIENTLTSLLFNCIYTSYKKI